MLQYLIVKKGKIVNCVVCGKEIYKWPCFLKKQKIFTCSHECKVENQRSVLIPQICEFCHKEFLSFPSTIKWNKERKHKHLFCGNQCRRKWYSAERHPGWKGGRIVHQHGYILIYVPDHPFPDKGGKYVFEHRYIMEKHLGRFLTADEDVHHINHVRDDNRLENLQLISSSNHAKLHDLLRKRDSLGRII